MTEAWPLFLAQTGELAMLEAQAVKDVADAHIVVKSDDDGAAYEAIAKRADGRDAEAEETTGDDLPEWQKTKEGREEWYQKKRAELYRVQQAMTNRSPDELPRN